MMKNEINKQQAIVFFVQGTGRRRRSEEKDERVVKREKLEVILP